MRAIVAAAFTFELLFLSFPALPEPTTPTETKVVQGSTLTDRLKATGKTGVAQALVSVIALAFAFERVFNLRRKKIVPTGLRDQALPLVSTRNAADLDVLCYSHPSTLSRIIKVLMMHPKMTMSDLSTMAADLSSRELRMHLQRAYPLAVAATITPLLGLFGTVYGMVGAFEVIARSGEMGNAALMADSISYALMTTVLGLVIAIPSLALYHFFRMKTNILSLSLEEQATELIAE